MLLREMLGLRLREIRTEQGRSLRQVSVEARVSTAHLSEIERGRAEVSSELLAAICRALRVEVADLLVALIGMSDHDLRSTTSVHPAASSTGWSPAPPPFAPSA